MASLTRSAEADTDKRTVLKESFLSALEGKASIYHACKQTGIGRSTVYEWRQTDQEFKRAWDATQEDCTDRVEQVLFERALSGEAWAVCFYLKSRRRPVYGERVDHTTDDPVFKWPVAPGGKGETN